MTNKFVLASPVTQSRDVVKQLIAYHNHGQEPAEMPDFYRLTGEMVLVLNNKKDTYYVTTPKGCSCPAATYHPDQLCKHSRKYFPESMRGAAKVAGARGDSIRPTCKWPGGLNGPVNEPVKAVV